VAKESLTLPRSSLRKTYEKADSIADSVLCLVSCLAKDEEETKELTKLYPLCLSPSLPLKLSKFFSKFYTSHRKYTTCSDHERER
jgi:hypothetical protein